MTCDIVMCITWHFTGQYDHHAISFFSMTQPPSNIHKDDNNTNTDADNYDNTAQLNYFS